MKKAFTIVELLMVIGIIGILTGIVTTAASGAIKNARTRRTQALCTMVQTGLSTYYAKKGYWPGFGTGEIQHKTNKESSNGGDDPDVRVLTGEEVRRSIREMVLEAKNPGGAVIDATGLFVSKDPGRYGTKAFGVDFVQARKGMPHFNNGNKMKVSDMYFGYPDPTSGYFRHFKIVYSIPTDIMTVSQMDSSASKANAYE